MSDLIRSPVQLNGEGRNHFLDSLKGICIILVIICHYDWTASQRLYMLFPFIVNMAVPVFMIISGYVYYLSYQKNNITTFEESWSINFILPKIIRYTIPFLMAMCVDFVCRIILGKLSPSFIVDVLRGGSGPGSYYYPIMIQFIFMYPLIYFFVKKYGIKGFALCFLINACYELFQRLYFVGDGCYRLLVFRYISVIAFGSFLASNHKQQLKPLFYFFSFVIGTSFIILTSYTAYSPKIIIYWTGTCFLATLYILPVSLILIEKCKNVRLRPFEYIGKASFNIFFTQMLYFYYFAQMRRKIFERVEDLYLSIALQNILNIVVCVILGLVFYEIERRITKKILNLLDFRK